MSLYHSDFHAWARQQADLLRTRHLSAADIDNIAEEIESMGRSEQRALEALLADLMVALLKWRYQPILRGRRWDLNLMDMRRQLDRHLQLNPSLREILDTSIAEAYADATIAAARDTGLEPETFPARCPWSFADMMDPSFRLGEEEQV